MEFTPQILDTILNLIQGALNIAIPFLEEDTRFLFQSFLVLSIVFSGTSHAFWNTSAGLEFLLKRILLVGFALFLVTNWLDLTNIVISSFGLLGLRAGGVSGAALTIDQFFSPGSIMTLGFGLADQLSEQADNVSGRLGFSAISFFLTIAAFFVALAFVMIALQVFMTLIEFKLVTLGGFILLPFALLDRTTSLAQGALGYVIAAELKLFALAVVVAFAIFPAIAVPEEFDTTTVVTIIGVARTSLMLAIRAPGPAASMISGGPQRAEQAAVMQVRLKAEIVDIDRQIRGLVDRIVEASTPTVIDAFETRIAKLESEKLVMTEKLEIGTRPSHSFEDLFELAFEFLRNPWKLWDSGQLTLQKTVLRLAFSERVSYCRNSGLRTAKIALPFSMLAGLEMGKLEMARPGGFEPPTS